MSGLRALRKFNFLASALRDFVMLTQLSPVHHFYIVVIQKAEIRWTLSNINRLHETYIIDSSRFGLATELNGSMIQHK